MAPKKAARQKAASKQAASKKAASKKPASNRAPAQSVQAFLQRQASKDVAAAAGDPNTDAWAVISEQESQVEQKFDDSEDIPPAQPDVVQQGLMGRWILAL